jgi:hypothetical protein
LDAEYIWHHTRAFLFLAEQAGEEAGFACRRCCFLSFRHVMAMTVTARTVVVIIGAMVLVAPVIFVVAIIIVTFMVTVITVIAVVIMIMPVAFMVIVTGRLSLC